MSASWPTTAASGPRSSGSPTCSCSPTGSLPRQAARTRTCSGSRWRHARHRDVITAGGVALRAARWHTRLRRSGRPRIRAPVAAPRRPGTRAMAPRDRLHHLSRRRGHPRRLGVRRGVPPGRGRPSRRAACHDLMAVRRATPAPVRTGHRRCRPDDRLRRRGHHDRGVQRRSRPRAADHPGPRRRRSRPPIARRHLVADNRNSQAPYVDDALLEPGAGTFAQPVKRWLAERLAQPYDLAALARAFHVSTRTMLRRFASETGQSPLDFLQQARVDAAKRLSSRPTTRSRAPCGTSATPIRPLPATVHRPGRDDAGRVPAAVPRIAPTP